MIHRPKRAALAVIASVLLAGCVGSAGASRQPVSTIGPGESAGPASSAPIGSAGASDAGSDVTDPGLKEALLVRFGDLVYCDPDFYPVARADESAAARDHLQEMRADTATWATIAGRLGFDPSASPSGDLLLAAYRQWKMLRAIQLSPTPGGQQFDAVFQAPEAPGATASATASQQNAADAGLTRVTGTILPDGSIVVASQEPGRRPACPICLARGTLIATPAGEIAAEALRAGDPVWTLDGSGRRVAAVVAETGSTPVPATHRVVDLVLADGRQVLVSPGHPLPDGRPVGALVAGDAVDGSIVVSAVRVAYDGGRTFDLLPSGPTGVYWAGGILLGSTLGIAPGD